MGIHIKPGHLIPAGAYWSREEIGLSNETEVHSLQGYENPRIGEARRPNGSGKSSIVDAFRTWALTPAGQTSVGTEPLELRLGSLGRTDHVRRNPHRLRRTQEDAVHPKRIAELVTLMTSGCSLWPRAPLKAPTASSTPPPAARPVDPHRLGHLSPADQPRIPASDVSSPCVMRTPYELRSARNDPVRSHASKFP